MRMTRLGLLTAVALGLLTSPAALAIDNLLYNPGFFSADPNDPNSPYGDGWSMWGAADHNAFWGPANPHASMYGNWFDNVGGHYQSSIAGLAGTTYQLELSDVRIEVAWDADLWFGFEYYLADDTTKVGESLVLIDTAARLANGQTDGNVFSMQATAVAGTEIVRPMFRFDNVNGAYENMPQANSFVFNTHMSVAPAPGDEYLKNADFFDTNGDGGFGDYWGKYGNIDFNEFFGPNNPHASLYADTIGNSGGVWQQGILGTPGEDYRLDLTNVRVEANFDADLYAGLEYYGADDFAKIGENIALLDTSVTGDGLSYSVTGTAVSGTAYVRPIFFFDNVATTGGEQRNVFIFATSLTELDVQILVGDLNCNGEVGFDDINPFVDLLVSGYDAWQAQYPDCPGENGDINGNGDYGQDGSADFGDINPFVELLTGS